MKHIFAGAAAAFFAMGSMASAASFTLDVSGASFTSIPLGIEDGQTVTSSNSILDHLHSEIPGTFLDGGFQSLMGYQGAQVLFSGGTNAKIKVELLGWEAGFSNSFLLDGQRVGKGLNGVGTTTETVAGSLNTPLDSFVTSILPAGILAFGFDSGNAPGLANKGGVDNGSNVVLGQNFFVSCFGNPSATSCNDLLIFYDDGDVAGDNHDDLVIRISAVPLPAGALLLLTGLGALALRRRKAA